MTTAEARRFFGSNYRIAQVLGIHRSAVGRWGRNVPKGRVNQLLTIAAMQGMEKGLGGDPAKMRKRK